MPFESSALPFSPNLILSVVAFAGLSAFVTGPMIGTRMIEQSGWHESCPAALRAEAEAQASPSQPIPSLDCQSMLGGLMPELGTLCRELGNPDFGGPMTGVMREQERLRREAEERRLNAAASRSASACSCAANVFLEDDRIAFALHAGSARLITPPEITSLESSLERALRGPSCMAR
jgi:hypothetical protein